MSGTETAQLTALQETVANLTGQVDRMSKELETTAEAVDVFFVLVMSFLVFLM